jgi:hypothetical protein
VVSFRMPNSDSNPPPWFGKLTEKFGHIKFPPGVIGKSSLVSVALLGLWALIVVKMPNDTWSSPLPVVGVFVTIFVVWWVRFTQRFAERNPGQAMLEGVELLEYHKFEIQAKGLPHIGPSPLTTDPGKPSPPKITDDRGEE